MTSEHLLPANATPLEQALSLATDSLARQALPADTIRQFKTDPSDPLLPWLIWEYGLGELLPYLPEPRQAIREGILWQRLRGTPRALQIALGWMGADAVFVEPEVPGVHFAEFQIDPGRVLDDDRLIADLIAIAGLSAPARSRLSRIYHDWDLRRFVLDDSGLGDALLSDHSGVFWRDGQTKLSFGRVRKFAHPPLAIELAPGREAVRFAVARLIDRYLLDFSALGDAGHTPNEEILHSHLFTLANAHGLPDPESLRPERRFARAMVVLSDSTVLGDINANLPRFVWREEGQAISLGGDRLSATPHRLLRVEVLERGYAEHPGNVGVPTPRLLNQRESRNTHRVLARADASLGMWALGESVPSLDQGFVRRDHTRSNPALPDAAGWRARLYQRAQVVLSEIVLGEVNARTPRRACYRIRPVPKLGDFALGESAEIEWRSLTEMQMCTSVLSVPLPYEFEAASVRMLRLLTLATASHSATLAAPSRGAVASTRAAWQGQIWTGVRWPASSWTDTREVIGTRHFTQ